MSRRGAPRWSSRLGRLVVGLGVVAAGAPAAAAATESPTLPFDPPRLADFLPAGETYDAAVPTPASVLGFEVGEWHLRPGDQLRYFEALAARSNRVTLEIQGYTHERRPQPLVIVTSPDNHGRLDEIRRAHTALSDPSSPAPSGAQLDRMPAVVWLGYSIHGNEASGANASPLVAYHLAAAESAEARRLLDQLVVLIDPSLNPDGLGRFAEWVDTNRGLTGVDDPMDREHREPWPGGRGNHYWFDLNRDWLPLQHPESRHRVATLRRWRPNLLGDYHEMEPDSTYFFQPGVPSRQNPLTPAENLELTRKIAAYHARALDAAGRLYYSEERFDDFYPGKGSTYPDLTGAVGVLFEQASPRGHRRESDYGPLSLSFAAHNQFLTSLSMLEAAYDLRRELLHYQRWFVTSALELAADDPTRAWAFGASGDPARAAALVEILVAHGVEVHRLERPVVSEGIRFEPGSAWLVPSAQPQYRLIRSLFETRTQFADSTFYDISAWTLPLAFGLPSAQLGPRLFERSIVGPRVTAASRPVGRSPAVDDPYAYLFAWSGYYAPRALGRLLRAGFPAHVATRPFAAETDAGRRDLAAGTVLVPARGQGERAAELAELIGTIAAEDGLDVYAATTGITPSGVDLGSPELRPVELPRPALVVGDGVSVTEAGAVWHLLDERFGLPVSLVDHSDLRTADLDRYTHLLFVGGSYVRSPPPEAEDVIRRWVGRGGTVVASREAASWAKDALLREGPRGGEGQRQEGQRQEGQQETARGAQRRNGEQAPEGQEPQRVPGGADRVAYADFEADRAAQTITGAIFRLELDTTHPLAFGVEPATANGTRSAGELPVFRRSTRPLTPSDDPYENVARYGDRPLVAGYGAPDRTRALAGTAAIVASRKREGLVVRFADDLAFRGFWYGTQKLYLNALFLSGLVDQTEPPERW